MANVLREITSITDSDCFYIVERHKSGFTWPIHSHEEYELNFIEGGKGVRRVVGDSIEEIGDFELTLITGDGLDMFGNRGAAKRATSGRSPCSSRPAFLTPTCCPGISSHQSERCSSGLGWG